MKILGVDPGTKGSLAFLNEKGELLACYRVPTYDHVMSDGKKRKRVDGAKVAAIIKHEAPTTAFIEDVHSCPKDGHVGAFAFGRTVGSLTGVLAALGVPTHAVGILAWKRAMRVTSNKGTAKARAARLFPGKAKLLKTADDCEAALIGLYGLMLLRSQGPRGHTATAQP